MGWMPIVQSWVDTLPEFIKADHKEQILAMFDGAFEVMLECCRFMKTPIVVNDNWLAMMVRISYLLILILNSFSFFFS